MAAEVETLCGSTCDYNNSGQADCRRQLLKRCTTEGTCCSSNDTCTCDCNTVAQNGCFGVSDGYTRCGSCKLGRFNQCYPTCKNDCNNNCKKKKGSIWLASHEGFSLYLDHASHDPTGDAAAAFHISFLDQNNGRLSCINGEKQLPNEVGGEAQGGAGTWARSFSHDARSWGWDEFIKVEDLDDEKHLRDGCLCMLCDLTVFDVCTNDYFAPHGDHGQPAAESLERLKLIQGVALITYLLGGPS
uniref:MATH domain-containing protein n=1 Tax=Triticum aestivum TaxID=4565 RepID=A0A077RR67_WHEAT|nr:unnamed protein product [Triticum aestivum]CDM80058.1 unnamed protein product [Triticum aestivum]